MTDYLTDRGSFESTIKRGRLSYRSSRLDALVEAINSYVANPNRDKLRIIESRWSEWRKEDPKEYSDRGKALEADLRAEMLRESEVASALRKAIWIPGPADEELDRCALNSFVPYLPNMSRTVLHGGRGNGELASFPPNSKLYILAHGHAHMPLFYTAGGGSWTARQIAEMLRDGGLNPKHRDIELLVCSAGESVNTKAGANAMMELRNQVKWADKIGNVAQAADIRSRYQHLNRTAPPTQFFELDPETWLLPLAAQLSAELRRRDFTNFRLISYKAPVAQTTNVTPYVHLDLTKKLRALSTFFVSTENPNYSSYRVVWQ